MSYYQKYLKYKDKYLLLEKEGLKAGNEDTQSTTVKKTEKILKKIFGDKIKNICDFYAKTRPLRTTTLNEYKIMKQRIGKYYKPMVSNRQIQTVIDLSHTQTMEYHSLLRILTKKVNIDDYAHVLDYILQKKSDTEIYNFLAKYMDKKKHKRPKFEFCCIYEKGNMRIETITNLIVGCEKTMSKYPTKFDKYIYLDLGCASGWKTIQIGEGIGLKKESIYGADINNWFDLGHTRQKYIDKFNFIKLEKGKPFPIKDKKFNFVTMLMVLHHIEDIDNYMKETNRIMQMHGLLYIREHDAFDDIDYMLIDVEHAMHARVYSKDYTNFQNTYYGKYFDWLEQTLIFEHYGFKKIYGSIISDSIRNTATPTRSHASLYYKHKNLQ